MCAQMVGINNAMVTYIMAGYYTHEGRGMHSCVDENLKQIKSVWLLRMYTYCILFVHMGLMYPVMVTH